MKSFGRFKSSAPELQDLSKILESGLINGLRKGKGKSNSPSRRTRGAALQGRVGDPASARSPTAPTSANAARCCPATFAWRPHWELRAISWPALRRSASGVRWVGRDPNFFLAISSYDLCANGTNRRITQLLVLSNEMFIFGLDSPRNGTIFI